MGTDRSLSSRNFGIDLLRVVAMFYVVTLHCIGPGGILSAAEIGSVQYHTAWFLEIWTYCAVISSPSSAVMCPTRRNTKR